MIFPIGLTVLDLGHVRGEGVPIPAFLIHLSDGQYVLVDTGCPAALIDDPQAVFAVDAAHHVTGQLALLGLTCADVARVVLTHLDPDHAGAVDEFPAADLLVQRAQHEHAATSGLHRYEWMRPHWDRPGLNYRLLDGDTEVVPGLTLVETGGHVPGHQSVVVRLPGAGTVILAGDAWMRGTDAGTRPMTVFDLDEPATRRSQARLEHLAVREGAGLVIHNHDREQWDRLRKAPDTYR